MSWKPRVSVLMPVRNGLPWLHDALDGLSRQTLEDIEIVVLEDGSTDGTMDLLASWHDRRLRIIRTGGVGIGAALNIGLAAARAPLVARHDADDVSVPERLERQHEYLSTDGDIGLLASSADYIDADGRALDNEWVRTVRRQQDPACTPEAIAQLMPLTCCITHGSIMARTELLRAAGGYRQELSPADDYDLWLRLLPHTRMARLPERLYRYRVHRTQISQTASGRQLLYTLVAKLSYLRSVQPRLPRPARMIVIGAGRGAACYRALAASHGFELVPPPPALGRDRLVLLEDPAVRRWTLQSCDVLVVSGFGDVEPYARALNAVAASGDAVCVGNFIVPVRLARHRAA
jgi:hypothetical protein